MISLPSKTKDWISLNKERSSLCLNCRHRGLFVFLRRILYLFHNQNITKTRSFCVILGLSLEISTQILLVLFSTVPDHALDLEDALQSRCNLLIHIQSIFASV